MVLLSYNNMLLFVTDHVTLSQSDRANPVTLLHTEPCNKLLFTLHNHDCVQPVAWTVKKTFISHLVVYMHLYKVFGQGQYNGLVANNALAYAACALSSDLDRCWPHPCTLYHIFTAKCDMNNILCLIIINYILQLLFPDSVTKRVGHSLSTLQLSPHTVWLIVFGGQRSYDVDPISHTIIVELCEY